MEWILGVLAVIALLAAVAVFVIVSGIRRVDHTFSEAHMIEFAQKLANVKEGIFSVLATHPIDQNDPRIMITSAGLVMFYTQSLNDEGRYVHHYSLHNHERGYTPNAVGGTFLVYTAILLGLQPTDGIYTRSDRSVYHAEFWLTEEQHNTLRSRRIRTPTEDEAKVLFIECNSIRQQLEYGRLEIPQE